MNASTSDAEAHDGDATPVPHECCPIEEERAAIRALRSGHTEAYRGLVRAHQQRLFSLVLMMTRDRPAAEEIVQDAFLCAYRHLDRFDEQRRFYPWLATIAVRLAQTWLRRAVSRHLAQVPASADCVGADRPSPAPQPLAALVDDEQAQRLWRRVESLSSGERSAVLLHYRQQMTVEEVAEQLGVTTGTVKTLLFRARHKLRVQYALEHDDHSMRTTR